VESEEFLAKGVGLMSYGVCGNAVKKPIPVLRYLLMILLVAGCGHGYRSSDFQSGDAEAAIREANSRLAAAARAGNADVLVRDFYWPGAVVMAANRPPMRGVDEVTSLWRGLLAGSSVELTLTSDDVSQACDMATEIGHYDLRITPKSGGARTHDQGSYVVSWRKVDGRWKAFSDIFHSSLPR
jgi:ketosteroid isomerase-like protein